MRNFSEIYYELSEKPENLPTIYCDMDNVLCDFLGATEKLLGVPFNNAEKSERWKSITGEKNFWENLAWMPGSKGMWSFINKYDARILSAYSNNDPRSKSGKLTWLKRNARLSQRSRIHLVLRADKQKYAVDINGEPNILIDDYIKNINEWKAKGGIGVHHTSAGDTIRQLKKLGFK